MNLSGLLNRWISTARRRVVEIAGWPLEECNDDDQTRASVRSREGLGPSSP